MNMQMCKNGHFYDADRDLECPHCKREESAGNQFPKTGIVTDFPTTGCYMKNYNQPKEVEYPKTAPVGNVAVEYPKTMPVGNVASEFPKTMPVDSMPAEFPKTAPVGIVPAEFPKTAPVGKMEQVPSATGWNPVLGWLVCVEGKKKGKDYRLTQEINYIGRATSNDICLDFDEELSRDMMFTIAYIKQNRVFRLNVEQSINQVFVNGVPVISEMYLRDKDVISIGGTKLKLVCFCDISFDWDAERGS